MKKFLNSFQKKPLFVKAFILFIAFGLVIFIMSLFNGEPSPQEGFSSSPAKVNYYYMDGCGHCEKFSPVWDEFTKSYNGSTQLKKINMKDAGNDLEKYKVDGFPTVVIIDENGKHEHYNGDRTLAALQSRFP